MNNPITRAAQAAWGELSTAEAQQWYKAKAIEVAYGLDGAAKFCVHRMIADTVVVAVFLAGLLEGEDSVTEGEFLLPAATEAVEVPSSVDEFEFVEVSATVIDIGDRKPTPSRYTHWSLDQLREECRKRDIHFTRDKRKTLITKLEAADGIEALEAA